jgi:hypothetical protein
MYRERNEGAAGSGAQGPPRGAVSPGAGGRLPRRRHRRAHRAHRFPGRGAGAAAGPAAPLGGMLRKAAPMHDIGKIGIPDNVLKKPGPLHARGARGDEPPRRDRRRHPRPSRIPLFQLAAEVALSAPRTLGRQRLPERLAGEAIPLSGPHRGGRRLLRRADHGPLLPPRLFRRRQALEMLRSSAAAPSTRASSTPSSAHAEELIALRDRINRPADFAEPTDRLCRPAPAPRQEPHPMKTVSTAHSPTCLRRCALRRRPRGAGAAHAGCRSRRPVLDRVKAGTLQGVHLARLLRHHLAQPAHPAADRHRHRPVGRTGRDLKVKLAYVDSSFPR